MNKRGILLLILFLSFASLCASEVLVYLGSNATSEETIACEEGLLSGLFDNGFIAYNIVANSLGVEPGQTMDLSQAKEQRVKYLLQVYLLEDGSYAALLIEPEKRTIKAQSSGELDGLSGYEDYFDLGEKISAELAGGEA